MAVTRRMKIVEELLFNVKNMEFARYASYISESDAVDINEFPHSELYKRYWLDTSNCVMEYQRKNKSVKRMVNKSNIIDTFARYCTLSTSELRKLIRDELTENLAWYEETFSICLRMKGLSLKVWKKNQELRSVSGDELTVFVLSVIFRKHTMIYTKTKPWTTYRVQQPMSVEELHAQCSIHLMYMGGGIFGLIHPLPYTIPSYHQINLVITHQLIHVTRTIGHSRTSQEPLDLRVSHSREIPTLPQAVEPVEISEARLTRIAQENAAQRDAFLYPVIDITESDPGNTTKQATCANICASAATPTPLHGTFSSDPTNLEYLMDSSPTDNLLGNLPDVTTAVQPTHQSGWLDTPEIGIISIPVATESENNEDDDNVDTNIWTPAFVPRKRLTDCKVKLRRLDDVDIALWCHPTRNNIKSTQNVPPDIPINSTSTDTNDSLSDVTGVNPTTPEPPSTSKSEYNIEKDPVSNVLIVPSPSKSSDDTDIPGQVNITETDKDATKQTEEPGTSLSDVTHANGNANGNTCKNTLSSTSGYSSEDFPDVTTKLSFTGTQDTINFVSSGDESQYRSKLRPTPLPRHLNNNSRTRRSIGTVNYTDNIRSHSQKADPKKNSNTSNRPGTGPSRERQSARHHTSGSSSTTYNVIPVKDEAAYDTDTDIISDNELDNLANSQTPPPTVTSDNVKTEEDDDNLPLSKLRDKLYPPNSTDATSPKKSKTRKGKLKLTTVRLLSHRKADKTCPICNIAKTSHDSLRDHISRRHSNLKCGICSKQFITSATLKKHKYTHLDKSWKCDSCDKSFYFKSELETHKIKHQTDKKIPVYSSRL